MKSKNNKVLFNMDERNKMIAYRIIAIMYFLTIIAINTVVIYRQFALKQDISQFEDLAVIMTINSIFLISALLFFGAVSIQKLKIKTLLLIYFVFVVLGALFTYAKYAIFQDPAMSMAQIGEKILIVAIICGILVLFFIVMSLLGKRMAERQLKED